MAGKFHIGKNGPAPCRATKRACRFSPEVHFDTAEQAQEEYEKRMSSETVPEGHKKPQKPSEETDGKQTEEKIHYSFLDDIYKDLEEQSLRFDELPDKFYSKSILSVPHGSLPTLATLPKDGMIEIDKAKEIAENNGFKVRQDIPECMSYMGNGFIAEDGKGNTYIILARKYKSMPPSSQRMFRGGEQKKIVPKSFRFLTYRDVVGIARLRHLVDTGDDNSVFLGYKSSHYGTYGKEAYPYIQRLKEEQQKGSNYLSTRRYLKESQTKIATAFEDKKHPDEEHLKMAKESPLRESFAYIEVDNDVDRAQWEDFEKSVQETLPRLPKIPGDRKPTLRVRYLGKHRASGLYNLGYNTIAIDVRDSSSFIHEYGHYFDMAVSSNASLRDEFHEIATSYQQRLQVPEDATATFGRSYYSTPTEIFARGFEMYAHERLGIRNRLVDPGRFKNFDYDAFDEDNKKKIFDLFDRMLS